MKRIHLITVIGLVHLFVFFSPAQSKSYRIERVVILAQVNLDSSMIIQETRTYRFKGRFKWADYRLPIKGSPPSKTSAFGTTTWLIYRASLRNAAHIRYKRAKMNFMCVTGQLKMYHSWAVERSQTETKPCSLSQLLVKN